MAHKPGENWTSRRIFLPVVHRRKELLVFSAHPPLHFMRGLFFSLSRLLCFALSPIFSSGIGKRGTEEAFSRLEGFYSAGAFFRHSLLAVPRRLTNQWIEEGPKKVASSTRPPLSGSPLFPFFPRFHFCHHALLPGHSYQDGKRNRESRRQCLTPP